MFEAFVYGQLCRRDKVHARPTSPGYLGSITKPLSAMAGLRLVQGGKLALDNNVNFDVLPLPSLLKPRYCSKFDRFGARSRRWC